MKFEKNTPIIVLSIILFSYGIAMSISESYAETSHQVTIPPGASVPGCEETNECYLPYGISIGVGEKITWVNDDSAAHTVTSGKLTGDGYVPDGIFDSGLFLSGNTFSVTFDKEGTYSYFCIVHPWMTGVVLVDENYNSQSDAVPDINIGTDKSLYFQDDTMYVSGTVSNLLDDFPVSLTITRPDGKTISVEQINVDNNKTFEVKLTIGGSLYNVDGVYSLYALYGSKQSVDLVAFEFRQGTPDLIPPVLLVPSDKIVDTTDPRGTRVEYTVKAIDDVDGVLESYCSPFSNDMFPIGSSVVTCNAVDIAGNQISKSFTIIVQLDSKFIIPDWIKEVASFWCSDEIDDDSFVEAIQYLMENEVIVVPLESEGTQTSHVVPSWIKNNACWWSQSQISDNEFVSGIEYLIQQGIINIKA